MSSIWNNGIQLSVFGESHADAVGVVIDRLPAGQSIDMQKVAHFMRRRQAKSDGTTTSRIEPDIPEVLSGLHGGTTNGTPLALLIRNTNTRPQDYQNIRDAVRPGHSDYTGYLRYRGANDPRGGGHFSGRLTAPLVAAGAICAQILMPYGISVGAFLVALQHIADDIPDCLSMTRQHLEEIRSLPFPARDPAVAAQMIQVIQAARMSGDSVGGMIQCIALGMPAGIGSPLFDGLESTISQLIFSIPGTKGIEFGQGFQSALQAGSQHNDAFYSDPDDPSIIKTKTNRHGGILGGISSGMPIIFRVAVKPTPSISIPQDTVNLANKQNIKLRITGRHDPCIAVRAVPVVEACCNIALLSAIIGQNGIDGTRSITI